MRIRWLSERDLSAIAYWGELEGWLVDTEELARIRSRYFYHAFGAYDGSFLRGALMGYCHEKTAWLCNFIVDPVMRRGGIGAKLFETALEAIAAEKQTQRLFAEKAMTAFYARYGFKEEGAAVRYELKNGGKTTTLLAAHQVRTLETKEHTTLSAFAKVAFGEARSEFIGADMIHKSSLMLASANGALHSRVIGKYVFVGPFLAREGAYTDAELLLRAVIAVRGMKPIALDVPEENSEAVRLLKLYGFKAKGATIRMTRGEPIQERGDMIYSFATAASHG
ncbi:MAG: GNAT family N-acetyltransferase [Helicobacteraceae bacterium]|nr:GNAT family N-acetyltransferase [Helicobacteraceae bacterium]